MNPFSKLQKGRKSFLFAVSAVILFLLFKLAFPTSVSVMPTVFDHMSTYGDRPVQLHLNTEIDQLVGDRQADEYQGATLTWREGAGMETKFDTKVKVRGASRRTYCEFPPLKVKFKKKDLKKKGLCPETNLLKLVTHCNDDDQFVLKEYLVYKLYSLISGQALRVQLASIDYGAEDPGSFGTSNRYAFFIEHHDQLASRKNCFLNENKEKRLQRISMEEYLKLVVFQYMIGNTDWNLNERHNVKVLQSKESGGTIPIPYDFDMAGLVNSPYARPYATLPIKSVTERFFQNRSKDREKLSETLAFFKEREEDIIKTCQDFPLLEKPIRDSMVDYLKSFFVLIDDPDKREAHFFAKS